MLVSIIVYAENDCIPNKVFKIEKRIQYMELIVFDMKSSPSDSFLSLVLEEIVS